MTVRAIVRQFWVDYFEKSPLLYVSFPSPLSLSLSLSLYLNAYQCLCLQFPFTLSCSLSTTFHQFFLSYLSPTMPWDDTFLPSFKGVEVGREGERGERGRKIMVRVAMTGDIMVCYRCWTNSCNLRVGI